MSSLKDKKSGIKVVAKKITRDKVRSFAGDLQTNFFNRARYAFWIGVGIWGVLAVEEQLHAIKNPRS